MKLMSSLALAPAIALALGGCSEEPEANVTEPAAPAVLTEQDAERVEDFEERWAARREAAGEQAEPGTESPSGSPDG